VSLTIYEANEAGPVRRFSGLLTLALGVVLSAWYARDIGKTVRGDIETFLPSFKTLPILTVVFAVFKFVAYIAFGALFVIMIYVPLRNLLLNRLLIGRIDSVEQNNERGHRTYVSVKLNGRIFRFRDPGGLKSALDEKTSPGDSVRFVLGAFGRVEKVEKLS